MRATPTKRSAHRATVDDTPQALTMPREPRLFPETTHVKTRAFLVSFVGCGSRQTAAELAGMDDRMHWYWLKTDPIYREAFERAEQMAGDCVEDRLYTLALEGTRKGVYHQGLRVGEEDVVYPSLILAALNGIKGERYRYRGTQDHTISPALTALIEQWRALRDEPPAPSRAAFPAPIVDAEIVADQDDDPTFRLFDRIHGTGPYGGPRGHSTLATTSSISVGNEADGVMAAGDTPPCAMLDTPSQPLYTRIDVPVRTVPVQTAS